jgi:hypothetical protein
MVMPHFSPITRFTAALPLVLTSFPSLAEAVPVSPVVAPVVAEVTEAVPVVKKSRKSTKASDNTKALDKTPRKRSPKTATAAAQ